VLAKVEPAVEPKQIRRAAAMGRETRQIPASQFGRVRALTRYGMTRARVAEFYGVTVNAIEKISDAPDQPANLDPLISVRTQLPVLDSGSDAVHVREMCLISTPRHTLGVVAKCEDSPPISK
jgi:hypothetical protein